MLFRKYTQLMINLDVVFYALDFKFAIKIKSSVKQEVFIDGKYLLAHYYNKPVFR